jgi:hypothetical protein
VSWRRLRFGSLVTSIPPYIDEREWRDDVRLSLRRLSYCVPELFVGFAYSWRRPLQIQKPEKVELIVGAFSQGTARRAESAEMAKISFPLLDKRRCPVSLSVSGKEDFFKHTCASMLLEAQASVPGVAMSKHPQLAGAGDRPGTSRYRTFAFCFHQA